MTLFDLIQAQQDTAVLSQQLPAQPATHNANDPNQSES